MNDAKKVLGWPKKFVVGQKVAFYYLIVSFKNSVVDAKDIVIEQIVLWFVVGASKMFLFVVAQKCLKYLSEK